MSRMEQREESIDILKAICAFMIVCIHAPFPGAVGICFTVLSRIAVPIFFMITGYFYSDVVKKGKEHSQIKKIVRLVIEANLLYFLWDVFRSFARGNSSFFVMTFTPKNMLKLVLFNESPFAVHLWYLNAILYVLLIILIADKLNCRKILYVLTPVFLIGDLLFGKYSIAVLEREFPYILVRNFIFVGIPYFCIGCLVKNGLGKIIEKKQLGAFIVLFAVTSILERYILVICNLNAARDHYISTTFLAMAVFLFTLKSGGKCDWLAAIGRKYATSIYIVHLIMIELLGAVSRRIGVYEVYKYIAPIAVYMVTWCILMLLDQMRLKLKSR